MIVVRPNFCIPWSNHLWLYWKLHNIHVFNPAMSAMWFRTIVHTQVANFVTFKSSSGNCMVMPVVEAFLCHCV
jgi:hypothetical protein